ncbi:hypothetical protein LCM4577_33105 [Mesorhizobium sp. LCM 4577]|nr:hypothetical protein LCM4577_33105 [Mesorhizobium sp. LCM 4577]
MLAGFKSERWPVFDRNSGRLRVGIRTFDHLRSEEVFRLFGEMAKVGQVIYLTHHQHLCEIAKSVVPNVAIHELG